MVTKGVPVNRHVFMHDYRLQPSCTIWRGEAANYSLTLLFSHQPFPITQHPH